MPNPKVQTLSYRIKGDILFSEGLGDILFSEGLGS